MLLNITSAGHAARQAALIEGVPMSKIDRFVIGAGPASPNLVMATELNGAWYEAPILSKQSLSETSTKLTGEIPSSATGNIVEVGLLLEDGTLFAAAAFNPEVGGQLKGAGFSYSFFCVISDEQASDLQITYAALDVDALAQEISDQANARIIAQTNATLFETVAHLSGLNRDLLAQQDKLNTLEALNV